MPYNHKNVFTRNNPSINKIGQLTNEHKPAIFHYDEFTEELIIIEPIYVIKPQIAIVDNNNFVTFKSKNDGKDNDN